MNEDHAQFMGAWFEIMLYGWLLQMGETQVEPDIDGNNLDFILRVDNYPTVAIEARAVLTDSQYREQERRDSEVFGLLNRPPRSYAIYIKKLTHGPPLDTEKVTEQVLVWLDGEPYTPYFYNDNMGNEIVLEHRSSNQSVLS